MAVKPIRTQTYPAGRSVRLPAGSQLWKQGGGWWLYYNPARHRTYLVYRQGAYWHVYEYQGRAVPPCCA